MIEDYCMVMKPLATTLDFLQGKDKTYFGFLLPSLVSLLNKYEKLAVRSKLKYGGEHLVQMCINSLTNRFKDIVTLK